MDYNSLSDDDLIALSQKNYDALSDDGLLFLSQSKVTPEQSEPSQLKTFGKSFVESIVPSAAGLAAGVKGAAVGASIMPPVLPVVGPFAKPLGGLVGGIAGGVLGGMAGQTVQDFATQYIPEEFKQSLGMDEVTRKAENEAHPLTSFAGHLAPNLAAFRPGALPALVDDAGKVVLSSGAQRVGMAGVGGGIEAGAELLQDGKIDPAKVGMAAAFQGVAATPTKFGKKFMNTIHPELKPEVVDPFKDAPTTETNNMDAVNKAVFLDNSIVRIQKEISDHVQVIEKIAAIADDLRAVANPTERQIEALSKIEKAIASKEAKVEELQQTVKEHSTSIDELLKFANVRHEDVLPNKEEISSSANIVPKKESIFRTDNEAWTAKESSFTEAASSMDALLKTKQETKELISEREKLIEKRNKTLEDRLRLSEIDDKYLEITVRNDPRNELQNAITEIQETLNDYREFAEDYGPEFLRVRIPIVEKQLAQYREYQRRVENAISSPTQSAPEHLIRGSAADRAMESIEQALRDGEPPVDLPPPNIDTVENISSIPTPVAGDTLNNSRNFTTETGDIGFHSSNEFLNKVINFPLEVVKRFLNPWALKNFFPKNRLIVDVSDMAYRGRNESTQLKNEILFGVVGEDQFKADFGDKPLKLFKLDKIKTSDSLLQAIAQVKFKDISKMIEGFVDAYRDGVSPYQNVDKYFPNATAEQKNFVRVVELASKKMLEQVNRDLKARGLPLIKEVPGYFPVSNVGKYYVDHVANGQLLERNFTFFSKKEAQAYADRLMQNDSRTTAHVGEREQDVDYKSIMDVLNEIITSGKPAPAYAQYVKTQIETKASQVGKHKEHRNLIRGFSGERIGNEEERGRNFAQGLVNWVNEYANSARVRKLMFDSSEYMSRAETAELIQKQPNAEAVVKHFLDNELNVFGTKAITKSINDFGSVFQDAANETAFMVNGKHIPKDELESGFNVMRRLGYNINLTSAPVTWISQALAPMQAGRMLFKEGANPLEAVSASFKGIAKTFFKSMHDEDSMRGFLHVSQTLDILHKTIHADLGGVDAASVNKSQLDKWYARLVGEKLTEGADTFSRVVSYNMAYEFLKNQGMSGKALWEEAGRVANENMIPMGRENLPTIYKELGWFGTAMSPLKGFIHGQMSNLAVDVKGTVQGTVDFAKNPNAQTFSKATGESLALMANMLSMMIMGGLLGLPFLADYEYIRQLLVKAKYIGAETLPSWTKVAEQYSAMVSRGLISGLSGIDMSASTRYQSIMKPFGDIANAVSWADASLPFSATKNLIVGTIGVAKDIYGNVHDPEAQKNWDKVLPRGIARGIKDDLYDRHGFTQFGKRGEAMVERTPLERTAKYLGSSSVAESKARNQRNEIEATKMSTTQRKQYAVDLMLSSTQSDKDAGQQMIKDLYMNGDISSDELKAMLKNEVFKQNRPVFDRMITNNQGKFKTKSQARNLRELMEMGYERNE